MTENRPMAYSVEYRGLKALERLVDAVDAIRKPGASHNYYACMELHDASNAVRELFSLDGTTSHRVTETRGDNIVVEPIHGERYRDYSTPEKPEPQPSEPM